MFVLLIIINIIQIKDALEILKFASIDIGSNAVRLLFMNVIEDANGAIFKKSSLIRMPIRLGDDVFQNKPIPQHKIDMLLHAMFAFKHMMYIQRVVNYKAYATSAMREASNSLEVIRTLEEFAGVKIEIINGTKEAEIIYSNNIAEMLKKEGEKTFLYVDVGGGSTETTLFAENKILEAKSFNVGTLRILKKTIKESDYQQLKEYIEQIGKQYKNIEIIGSGGNINCLIKISKTKEKKMYYTQLLERFNYISSFSFEDRVKILGMNPDRADVVIPAATIFMKIMNWGNIKLIHVPKIGLTDGIIHQLYNQYKDGKASVAQH